ncbi:unnamed protein product [Camellia sinensis]
MMKQENSMHPKADPLSYPKITHLEQLTPLKGMLTLYPRKTDYKLWNNSFKHANRIVLLHTHMNPNCSCLQVRRVTRLRRLQKPSLWMLQQMELLPLKNEKI